MSRKDSIDSLFLKKPVANASSAAKSPDRVRTGAISAMGSSLHEMAENAKQATKLQQQLAEGEAVISIDASSIDSSKIADRIPIDIDPDFDALVESIAEHGQQVPILVRPNPQVSGRFQIAYGRRRLKAAEKLGRPVRAIVRSLSDSQLYIAQGRENLDRKDLSFIEKAFFAKNLEENGCDRATIISALATDKADVSRYIAIARQLPEDLVKFIGPAPKAGRARWMALVEHLATPDRVTAAYELLSRYSEERLGSDARLDSILRALNETVKKNRVAKAESWKIPSGKRGARIESKAGKTTIIFEDKAVPDFALFVSGKLDELYKEFREYRGEGDKL
ncbi:MULTISPECIES: plasmid partitioning protein RepB [Alphaproteobacteria]|jgi:ParB family chromosome partitioning protein|uniref:Plasmid partitioning protein RepB n=2 Tax=Alphaproteobacteria TaxID=28211 RepID=A0A512HPI1_9HYPH|nr:MULTISPECIES: plasmid partitioning protein RepB [Alphaproteobacteria]GEO87341.1 plasmid partitioning protein RepB [Ciceribacter naphthalenivorans]GLR23788.1 plasmid partitioning protein RepB [Ciceribacter naphthalenivorans]GLT06644.1 plasmid partitioning protein RepB [Sphingomonas psychrolutea]CDN95698.1 Plasmid partitioning protein, RepB [Agrobacterium tumefaciens]